MATSKEASTCGIVFVIVNLSIYLFIFYLIDDVQLLQNLLEQRHEIIGRQKEDEGSIGKHKFLPFQTKVLVLIGSH